MRTLVTLVLLGGAAASACSSSAGSDAHAPRPLSLADVPPVDWRPYYMPEFDQVAAAAGLTPLRDARPQPGWKEVRAWIGGELGYPREMYRLRIESGVVRGQVFHYWRRDRDPAEPDSTRYEVLIRRSMRGPCGEIVRNAEMEACQGALTASPDWSGILREAEAAGLWSLPDEDSLRPRSVVLDGWTMVIETRDGAAYRSYRYSNPRLNAHPESARALAIARAFGKAMALSVPSEVVLRYRGLLRTGPSLSEFVPCGSAERWGFQGDLRGLRSAWSDRPRSDTLATGVQQDYVEATGEVMPEWLARRWRSEYRRVLQVQKVDSVAAWSPGRCDGASPPVIPR